ncbi:MBL fold metallo-hydrolase [Streptomyces sp. G6]|uniref:MBL fold metallo-hydrolase n=1 Tax=Streptomyces sp. G6 TaxID=1178736 RepID=UPI003ED9FA8D
MDVIELLPRLHLLRFPVGQAYVWRDGDDLTLIDAGPAGSAARVAALAGAEVVAHVLEAPVVRGEVPGPPPVFEEWERPLHADAVRRLPRGGFDRPARVPEVSDGDVLDFGGGARVVHAPGHTDGGIGLHLPRHGVLFTGDAVAASPVEGGVMPGVFNTDRDRAVASFGRLAGLDIQTACFGHGDPVTAGAGEALRASARARPAEG